MRRRPKSVGARLHPVLRRVYGARGVASERELDLSVERLLPVSTLGGVAAAVDLLIATHEADRRIVVVGDFDADGATSTAARRAPACGAWGFAIRTTSSRTGFATVTD
jgi:single-stranded-DNA-specific exonuclease